MSWKKTCTTLICLTSSSLLYSVDVATSTELQDAIVSANAGGDTTINCTATIDLSVPFNCPFLRPLNVTGSFTAVPPQTITINGNGNALIVTGGSPVRGIFAFSGNSVINDVTFTNTTAQGGTAFTAGGGGAGLGGALFVATGATVTLSNPIFNNSRAIGGDGGPAGQGSGGGGGLLGNGGQGFNVVNPTVPVGGGGGGFGFNGGAGFNGGGGGAGVGFDGDDAPTINDGGGNGGGDFLGLGGGPGGTPGNNGSPGASGAGGGGGGKDNGSGGAGGTGGGGGGGAEGQGNGNRGGNGGDGGAFGGGGGGGLAFGGASPAGNGGNGGFAGGGGGSGTFAASGLSGNGGNGGFGGGGGGTGALTPGSIPGTGGPTGSTPFFGGSGGADAGGGGGGGGAGCGGAIFIQNGGTLTILGSAQFNGDRAIAGAGGGGGATSGIAAGADIFMMAGGSLIVNNTTNINIPNPIAGDQGAGGGTGGGLSKLGCARLTLNGANTYTGTTTVSAGELRIDGSATTDISVAPGAILSGNFSTTGSIDNAGIIAPGDGAIGTISMTGTFTNQATGIVQADITPVGTVHDFIIAGAGGATLIPGSTLDIVVNAGNYIAGTQYVVINAPVTGTFGTNVFQTGVNANLIDIGVTYTNGVVLTILQNFIFQNQAINPGIPSAVSRCIEVADITPGSDFANIIQQMGLLNSRDVNRALYNMSPVNYGALDWINARNNNYIADIIDEHLFELCCSPRDCCPCGTNMSVWLDVFGNLMYNTKHYGHMNRFNAEAVGVITGLDYCFCENYTVGAGFAYTHTWLQWKKHHGHGNIDSYYGILYGRYDGCCFDLDISLIGGGSNHHLHRNIDISGTGVLTALNTNLCAGTNGIVTTPVIIDIDRTAKGDPWGYFFTGHLGISTDWEWCCTNFEPYALIDYNYFHREEFREHGAGDLNLSVREHIQNMLRGEVGVRAYRTWDCDCFCFAPYLGLSWVGEFPLSHSKQRAHFVGRRCTFSVNSYNSSIQLVSPEAGIKFTNPCGFSMWVGYKGLYNSSTNINQVDLGIEWAF